MTWYVLLSTFKPFIPSTITLIAINYLCSQKIARPLMLENIGPTHMQLWIFFNVSHHQNWCNPSRVHMAGSVQHSEHTQWWYHPLTRITSQSREVWKHICMCTVVSVMLFPCLLTGTWSYSLFKTFNSPLTFWSNLYIAVYKGLVIVITVWSYPTCFTSVTYLEFM